MADKIHLYKDEAGDYRWRRVSENGREVGASTEGYERRSDAMRNVESTQAGDFVVVDET